MIIQRRKLTKKSQLTKKICKLKRTFRIFPTLPVPFSVQLKVGILFRYLPTFRAKVLFFTLYFFWCHPLGFFEIKVPKYWPSLFFSFRPLTWKWTQYFIYNPILSLWGTTESNRNAEKWHISISQLQLQGYICKIEIRNSNVDQNKKSPSLWPIGQKMLILHVARENSPLKRAFFDQWVKKMAINCFDQRNSHW